MPQLLQKIATVYACAYKCGHQKQVTIAHPETKEGRATARRIAKTIAEMPCISCLAIPAPPLHPAPAVDAD